MAIFNSKLLNYQRVVWQCVAMCCIYQFWSVFVHVFQPFAWVCVKDCLNWLCWCWKSPHFHESHPPCLRAPYSMCGCWNDDFQCWVVQSKVPQAFPSLRHPGAKLRLRGNEADFLWKFNNKCQHSHLAYNDGPSPDIKWCVNGFVESWEKWLGLLLVPNLQVGLSLASRKPSIMRL